MIQEKYLWFTDPHLSRVMPWNKIALISYLRKENPSGIFLTGDISNGFFATLDLKILSTFVKCPIYFVLGNHDYYGSSFGKVHSDIKSLCKKNKNLVWLTDSEPVSLSNDSALIGTEGWYDGGAGNPKYLAGTIDWFMIEELRKLNSSEERLEAFRNLASTSAKLIEEKIDKAFSNGHSTVYILTHFPPWKEATHHIGTFFENYWLPYNTNVILGETIEKVMKKYPGKNAKIMAGHSHEKKWIHVANNIECRINSPKHFDLIRNEEHVYI